MPVILNCVHKTFSTQIPRSSGDTVSGGCSVYLWSTQLTAAIEAFELLCRWTDSEESCKGSDRRPYKWNVV